MGPILERPALDAAPDEGFLEERRRTGPPGLFAGAVEGLLVVDGKGTLEGD